MNKITIWYRMNEKNIYEFNHIEDGHASTELPFIKVPEMQKGWAKGKWSKEFAELDNNIPPKIVKLS